MNLLDRFRRWLSGENECPRCGAVHYRMGFGYTRIPCSDCWGEHDDMQDFIKEEQR